VTVDFSSYQAPGTYIDEQQSTLVTVSGLSPSLIAIVGPSQGYQSASEQAVLGSAAAVLLNRGIVQASVAVRRLDTNVVLATSEFTLTTQGDLPSENYYTSVTLAAAAITPAGTPVVVTYNYVDPNFFAPKIFSDFDDVKNAYGEPLNLTPPVHGATSYTSIISPLSLAAKIAFDNGVTSLLLVATTPPPVAATTSAAISAANRAALNSAYNKIEQNFSASVIVPLTDGIITADAPGVGTDLKNSTEQAAADGFPRTGMLGFEAAVTTIPPLMLSTGGFASKRVMFHYCAPGGMAYYSSAIARYLALGHQYLAVAAGARLAAGPPQRGLTSQVLNSFSGFSGPALATRDKNTYAAAGIAITEVDITGNVVVRHGVTTDTTSINTREVSVIRGRDAMLSLLLNVVRQSKLIGSPVVQTTLPGLKSVIAGALEYSVATQAILGYAGLKIRQRSVDPSVVEVVFSYAPIYPLNYIVLSFGIDLTAGSITPTA
jgi:hypothetical protein